MVGPLEMNEVELKKDLKATLLQAIELGAAFALYRLPNQKDLLSVVCFDPVLIRPSLERIGRGFLIGDFDFDGDNALFLKADWFFNGNHWEIENKPASGCTSFTLNHKPKHTAKAADFIAITQKAIETMQRGQIRKIVLSRFKNVDLKSNFDVFEAFKRAAQSYPTAFVSLVSTPNYGTWLGASPEMLLSIDEKGIFRTVALAGTQLKNGLEDLSQALWRQKEIEEQALVSRYIINCLKKIRVREYEDYGPKTIEAGHLIHLLTDFEVDTKSIAYPQMPSVMLGLLHPTSAVCGMPKPEAMRFIKTHEGYPRSLYSGFLGPTGNSTSLFVNLRCAQIHCHSATLYAGAGITVFSKPEQELQETENKMMTVGSILGM